MKNLKARVLAMLLALCFALSGTAFAAVLSADAENGDAVDALYDVGVILGDPDGSFRPGDNLTLAETAALLSRAFALERTGDNDIDELSGHWAYDYIMACLDNSCFDNETNVLEPDSEVSASFFAKAIAALGLGTDAPDSDSITRAEAASVLYGALCMTIGDSEYTYLDLVVSGRLLAESELLRYFTLAAYYEDNMINAIALTDEPDAFVYISELDGFVRTEAAPENVIYNFVGIFDADGDELGDTLFIVPREDGNSVWDSDMTFTAGGDPYFVDAFVNEYNIPYGERELGFEIDGAAVDFSNITVSGDLANDTYYYTYDWYNSSSTDTLTLLSNFKTLQQATGWTCGVTDAVMVLEWFGLRDGLNELDLGALRNTKEKFGAYRWGGATDVRMLENVFSALNEMEGTELWNWESTYDYVDADGNLSEEYLSPEWIKERLNEGRPVMVGWNAFGGHWQIIIGYDDMGTELTADDVLIMADSYDSTDHRNDGYNVQPYQRLVYDWTQDFDRDFGRSKGYGMPVMFAPYPVEYNASDFAPVKGGGLAYTTPAAAISENDSDDMLIPYGATADDLADSKYERAQAQAGDNGMAGPASSKWFKQFQQSNSPYFPGYDFYGNAAGISDTLTILNKFQTSQQASEWTCGPSALRMVLNWYDVMGDETEFSLAQLREDDKEGATTLDGMTQIIDQLDLDLVYLTTDDMDDDGYVGDYNLYDGAGGLIEACVMNGIPVLIGWDEWGGHWQVIIGFDDMGTEETQDDVIILADPYDTTDHLQDGYVIEGFERLVYGWGAAFDPRGGEVFLIAAPADLLAEVFG